MPGREVWTWWQWGCVVDSLAPDPRQAAWPRYVFFYYLLHTVLAEWCSSVAFGWRGRHTACVYELHERVWEELARFCTLVTG